MSASRLFYTMIEQIKDGGADYINELIKLVIDTGTSDMFQLYDEVINVYSEGDIKHAALYSMMNALYKTNQSLFDDEENEFYSETPFKELEKMAKNLDVASLLKIIYGINTNQIDCKSITAMKNEFGKAGLLNITNNFRLKRGTPYLYVRYNRVLLDFRNYYYQVCSDEHGDGDYGHSTISKSLINKLDKDSRVLLTYSSVLEVIGRYHVDKNAIYEFIAASTRTSVEFVKGVITEYITRVSFDYKTPGLMESLYIEDKEKFRKARIDIYKYGIKVTDALGEYVNISIPKSLVSSYDFADNAKEYIRELIILALNEIDFYVSTTTSYATSGNRVQSPIQLNNNATVINTVNDINTINFDRILYTWGDIEDFDYQLVEIQNNNKPSVSIADIMSGKN